MCEVQKKKVVLSWLDGYVVSHSVTTVYGSTFDLEQILNQMPFLM